MKCDEKWGYVRKVKYLSDIIASIEFAKKYDLEVIQVIKPEEFEPQTGQAYTGEGTLINSKEFNGVVSMTARKQITEKLVNLGKGQPETTYKLRDWIFSRQRYWGEPIPLIHKQNGGMEPICKTKDQECVQKKLPLELPDVPDYNPSADGTSPLEKNKEWVKTTDNEGNPARRETNTMPNWAGSCWYYLRYTDPKNDQEFADKEKMKYWLPVDKYFGGAEHTTMHLLYSRFWHKFFYDQGLVPTSEPYQWRMNGGLLLGPDGTKMSKSKGNVISPMNMVE
jgi:leucyl-tRNA synthetase